jgi:O-antigen ligase
MSKPGWLSGVQKTAWACFLVSLPVTSFPFFPAGFGGSTQVRPLALYPLLVLILIVLIPSLLTKKLPRTLLPFLGFILIVVASSILAIGRGLEPDLGTTVVARTIRSFVTLGIGSAIYLVATLIPETSEDLRFALRWLYIGFVVALFWGSLQVVYVLKFNPVYFDWISKVQNYISIRKLFTKRISGMTYEPNWFAEQIGFLLLPWLFAAVLSRTTVFRWRWRWLTIEALMLVWAVGVLIFTYSRTGLILVGAQLFLSLLLRPRKADQAKRVRRDWKSIAWRVLQASLAILVLGTVAVIAGRRNNYFSRLWRYWVGDEGTGEYLEYIAFSQRFTYWDTAFEIFEDFPILGVGLGNYAFYFDEYLDDRPLYRTPELLRKVTPAEGHSQLVTPKNLYFRLLSETGLVGTGAFLGFVFAVTGCALSLWYSKGSGGRYWGRAGLLGMIVFAITALSFDSFSIPNMWVVFGLVTAAARF